MTTTVGVLDGSLGAERADLTERMVSLARPTIGAELRRAAGGLALAATYGVALGARGGGAELWRHALGVPAGLAAVALVGVPSLFVFLALRDAPVTPTGALSATCRALGTTGLVLAGLAPAAALFVITIGSAPLAAASGMLGLLAAGAIGLVHLLNDLSRQLRPASASVKAAGNLALAAFAPFSVLLVLRVWWALLPIMGGAR